MIPYRKKYHKTIRLNSYHPLCSTAWGLMSILKNQLPPFVDASCRREPDFENDCPSISSLCRQELFAPHLYQNDIVAYITVKGPCFTDYPHYRLVAILEVIERRDSHNLGSNWYTHRGIMVPSNCMVEDNAPLPFDYTAGDFEKVTDEMRFMARTVEQQATIGARRVTLWNERYQQRALDYPTFIITKPIFIELYHPPILTLEKMADIFGKVPNTRNPNIIKKEQFKELARFADIDFIYE